MDDIVDFDVLSLLLIHSFHWHLKLPHLIKLDRGEGFCLLRRIVGAVAIPILTVFENIVDNVVEVVFVHSCIIKVIIIKNGGSQFSLK